MHRLSRLRVSARPLLAAGVLLQFVACTGEIRSPAPATPPVPAANMDRACPSMIPDQATNVCPRLKNITLSCGGNGMLHTSVGGGSGSPIVLGVALDAGSVLSAVLVLVNCQDGPREGVTFGVTYTGEASIPPSGPPCVRQSKAVYSQFQFGNPIYAGFEGIAKDKMHQTLDEQAITNFAATLGLAVPSTPRCSVWRQMP